MLAGYIHRLEKPLTLASKSVFYINYIIASEGKAWLSLKPIYNNKTPSKCYAWESAFSSERVSHGSILGSVQLVIYTNDLPLCLKNSFISMNADNTPTYYISQI